MIRNPLAIFIGLWAVLPFSLGAAIDSAFAQSDDQVRTSVSVGVWIAWGLVLGSSIIRRPWGLTIMRILAPATVPTLLVTHWSATMPAGALATALSHAVLVSLLALLPETGHLMVDGLSYGDEKRFLLRVPTAVLFGPLPLVWAITVSGIFSGPILVTSGRWGVGLPLWGIGWTLAVFATRSMHQLARRWIVFVPNGFVIHDYLATREPFLLRRQDISSLGPAAAEIDVSSEDLIDVSQLALGPVLHVVLRGDVEVVPRSRGVSEVRQVAQILFSPTRPGVVLGEAHQRKLLR
tara:strand:- start:17190 stop:18068 length:879 start_codon:yes stop_codon:yes gene_type:complete